MEYAFGLLKPDCLKRGMEKKILSEIEAAGLQIMAVRRVRLTKKEVDAIWQPCRKENFYEELLNFFLSGDCLVFIAGGEDAINKLDDLVGHYEPAIAEKHTIRYRFGKSALENLIHSADDEKSFWRDALLFFSRQELGRLSNGGE